jgi:hypothetical protein
MTSPSLFIETDKRDTHTTGFVPRLVMKRFATRADASSIEYHPITANPSRGGDAKPGVSGPETAQLPKEEIEKCASPDGEWRASSVQSSWWEAQ